MIRYRIESCASREVGEGMEGCVVTACRKIEAKKRRDRDQDRWNEAGIPIKQNFGMREGLKSRVLIGDKDKGLVY